MYKLTLDEGLMREHVLAPAIATLKGWQMEGKIEIFETDCAETASSNSGWPGGNSVPTEKSPRRRVAPKKDPKVTAIWGRIVAVLFPMRDAHRLNISELNLANHLLRHLTLDRTIFVTRNTASFLDEEKPKKLQSVLQISIMTPEEVVEHLSQEQGWPLKKKMP